ncbi:hypothetical protein E3N88_46070 [Mikania micrantha]|uniref:Uncharacterized protein n=1 Tax=Mikania micrantha TaxID=192012 RepID=A0A5N6L7D0_9ASTR|nr:hypothetical protein E3N88_46070 [Mikania micrantha]
MSLSFTTTLTASILPEFFDCSVRIDNSKTPVRCKITEGGASQSGWLPRGEGPILRFGEDRVLAHSGLHGGTSSRSSIPRVDEAGPPPLVHNGSLESSMRNRIARLEQGESPYLLDKAKGKYWSDIKVALDHAPSQREYNWLLEFENRDLQIRELKHEALRLFQEVLAQNPALADQAPYKPREVFDDFLSRERDQIDLLNEDIPTRDNRELAFLQGPGLGLPPSLEEPYEAEAPQRGNIACHKSEVRFGTLLREGRLASRAFRDEAFWRSQVNFGPPNPATDEKALWYGVKGSVYVVTLPAFQRCLEDGPDAAERPGADSPPAGGQETAISRRITTYRQHRRDLGRQPDWESEDPYYTGNNERGLTRGLPFISFITSFTFTTREPRPHQSKWWTESKGELLRLSPRDTIRYLNRLKESESSKLPVGQL